MSEGVSEHHAMRARTDVLEQVVPRLTALVDRDIVPLVRLVDMDITLPMVRPCQYTNTGRHKHVSRTFSPM